MKKILKKLKGKITVFALAMLAFQPVLGLAALPMKTFAATSCTGSSSNVVINEIYVDPTDELNSEFVELYNNSPSACVDISGWKIQDDASANDATLPTGATIGPDSYYLIADSGWETGRDNSAWPSANYEETLNFYNSDAGVALSDGITVIDAVGYGTVTSYFEGNPETNASVANPNSLGRVTTGVDTSDNLNDFQSGTPTPMRGDATAPVITLTGANPQVIEQGKAYVELGANVTDNLDPAPVLTIDPSAVNTAVLGSYTVTYDAVDAAGNPAVQKTRTVNIVADATAPVITLTGANPQVIEQGKAYVELGANVTDNLDPAPVLTIDPSAVNTAVLGSYTVTYDAVDAAGNSAVQVIRTVNVVSPVVDTPVVAGPTTPVVTAAVQEVPVDNQVYGSESYQGEVKADQEIKADDGSSTEEQKEEKPEDTKGDKNVPLWGIIFLLILAGIGGYLFYSQSPEKTSGK